MTYPVLTQTSNIPQIGGWVSYNVRYTNTLRPGSTMTLRRLQSETSSS